MIFVNYKDTDRKSVHSAPNLVDILPDLYVNSQMCFGHEDEETDDEFVSRIITYLHSDLKERSSSSSSSKSSKSSMTSPAPKRMRNQVVVRDVVFTQHQSDDISTLRNRWELFALLGGKNNRNVHASCLVQFNDIYGTCEIHEVCVATTGKGLCKNLLEEVKKHLAAGMSGRVHHVLVYCKKPNVPACRCYASVFQGATVVQTPHTTGYIFTFHDSI